jgi:hypothetical protein
MSGGSYDYACWKVRDMADELRSRTEKPRDPDATNRVYDREKRAYLTPEESAPIFEAIGRERLWLVRLLELVSEAMHDVEWVDSCDYGPGDELAAIRAVRAYVADSGTP